MHVSLVPFAAMLLLLTTTQAGASGRIGPLPIAPQKFPDFAACKRHLQLEYANDQAAVAGARVAAQVGVTPERSIHTQGVVQTSQHEASYRVELGYLSKAVDEEQKVVRSQYSYSDKELICTRRTLTGAEGRGYHLESYEPLE